MLTTNLIKIVSVSVSAVALLTTGAFLGFAPKTAAQPENVAVETQAYPKTHSIPNVKASLQDTLMAGCETHACTSLLQSLGYDINEFEFADKYLECHMVSEDEVGQRFGPDMNSGFAGTAYAGWGVYAPAMCKFMNHYLSDVKSDKKAYLVEDTSLEDLCREYIDNDIPVMIWATTDMQEPIVYDAWKVDYVDENAKYKKGDTFVWMIHEHCLVLCGYDEKDYFFSDSVAGDVSHFEKNISEKRYEQLGYQAIVVK